jgi:hypothetical protein
MLYFQATLIFSFFQKILNQLVKEKCKVKIITQRQSTKQLMQVKLLGRLNLAFIN